MNARHRRTTPSPLGAFSMLYSNSGTAFVVHDDEHPTVIYNSRQTDREYVVVVVVDDNTDMRQQSIDSKRTRQQHATGWYATHNSGCSRRRRRRHM